MRKEIEFIHDEKNHSYLVCENSIEYTMPYVYMVILKKHLAIIDSSIEKPIETWFNSLRDIEKRIVEKKCLSTEISYAKNSQKLWL
jgi:hypothetical protein